jgi:hypothetical protein
MFCYLLAQEEAVGRLRVRVVAAEDGRPLPGASVHWVKKDSYDYRYFTIEQADGWRVRRSVPVGEYKITSASTDTHEWDGESSFSIEEGQETTVVLHLKRRAPYVHVSLPQRTFRQNEPIRMNYNVLTHEAGAMALTAYALDARAWLLGNPLKEQCDSEGRTTDEQIYLSSFGYNGEDVDSRRVQRVDAALQQFGRIVKRWTVPVKVGQSYEDASLPLDRLGLYVVRAQLGDLVTYEYALVTDLGVIVKQSSDGLIVYAQSLSDSRPLAGTRIEVFERDGFKRLLEGRTEASGVWQKEERQWRGLTLVFARYGDSVAWLNAEIYGSEWEDSYTVYLYTDRPIYRPKQTVYFKGIVRQGKPLNYTVPAGKRVHVEARDTNREVIYKSDLTLNEFGSFNGSFALPDDAPLGNYHLSSSTDDKGLGSTFFAVAEYRKPEFQVTVNADRKRYVIGETMRVTGNARYYFGSPVAKAKARYTVMRSYFWSFEEDSEFSDYYDELNENESYFYGEEVDWGEVNTNEQGEFSFDVPTQREHEVEEHDSDYQYRVQVEVTDSANRSVSANASALATRGDFDLTMTTDAYVYRPGDTVALTLSAEDFDHKPQANVEVKVEIFEPGSKKYPTASGRKISGEARIVKPPTVKRAQTDASGKARLTFAVPKRGLWEMIATATDARRHKITAAHEAWVASGSFYDSSYNYPDLALVPDKKIYNEGDTARVLINTSATNAQAIVSLEGARVYKYWLMPLKGGTQIVDVPIQRAYVPNVYLSVCFANGKHFVNRHALLKVSPKQRTLNVDVQPDKERYAPRDTATYTVRVNDTTGKPVRAEISLGLVDEAIYALREERKDDIIKAFYRPRYNAVKTRYSFPEIYLGGGKEDEIDAEKAARRDFRDTWRFYPSVVTDANGTTRVTLKVPDNLTTWRATVKAHTLTTSVGSAIQKVQVNKDLMVRLIAPRFLTQKDETTISAVVHNETRLPLTVRVHLNAQGVTVLDEERKTISVGAGKDEKANFRIAAPKAGEAKLLVSAIVVSSQQLAVSSRARNPFPPSLSDAMELTLPIQPHGVEQVIAQAGVADASVDGTFSVPENAIPEVTKLQVRLSPSVVGPIFGALGYLTGYPYGCVEQTTNSFIPNVIVKNVLNRLPNVPTFQLAHLPTSQDLNRYVRAGLQKLYDYQNGNGGWGWWEGSDGNDPYITSYVMFAFALTKQAGYEVRPDNVTRGMAALTAQFDKVREWDDKGQKRVPVKEAETKSFILFAYTHAWRAFGSASPKARNTAIQWFNDLFPLRQKLGSYTLALLTTSAHNLGLKEQAATLAEQLEQKAVWDGDRCHWQAKARRYDWMDSDIEATAYALKAMLKVKPDSHTVVAAVLWLSQQRRDNYWFSTKDTAAVVFALTDYMAGSKELSPNETINVYVNGKLQKTLRFTAADVTQPEVLLKFPGIGGRSTIRLEKIGSGKLYYAMTLHTYLREDPIAPRQNGLRVERTYSVKQGKQWVPYNGQTLNVNDEVRVNLKIVGSHPYRYAMVEDMLPSGCTVKEEDGEYSDDDYLGDSRREVRDNRVVFFFTRFTGAQMSYTFRPEHSGTHIALPTTAALMYQPEVRGNARETRLMVK